MNQVYSAKEFIVINVLSSANLAKIGEQFNVLLSEKPAIYAKYEVIKCEPMSNNIDNLQIFCKLIKQQ